MRYSDLIQFDPIESIVQLRESDEQEKALDLVRSYVISQDMEQRLSDVLFPDLLLDGNPDAKGVMIIGNYGSGKSHLMAMVSALAENAACLDVLKSEVVKKSAQAFAGRYQVIRKEIGSVTMGLREIILGWLSEGLAARGIQFTFPAAHTVAENKTALEDMMAAFHEKFPDQGLLLVVDELLDYLRSRKEQELVLDLGILREVGEICKGLRFRFIAGIQEAIFDSGRFQFVSQNLGRVKDRFDQVHIATSDVKFVVANRLLNKTEAQKKQIRQYLDGFAKFYGDWNERMDDLVSLFPVHPAYIDAFQKVPVIEKRGVLQVLSSMIHALREEEIPQDRPGILAFDSFWSHLINNPAFRTNPEVKEVIDCAAVLEDKVQGAYPKKATKDMALRIIQGIAVHRLTTNDIYSPLGLTPEELRDRLCLYHAMAIQLDDSPAESLLGIIELTLKDIRTTVSGQFLSQNSDNRQIFLDLKKTDDYDALIEGKAETLSEDSLNRAYYRILAEVLECTDPTSFSGFRIWQRAIPWKERNVTKLGWLFFGVPSERSTAQPPRDFYLYFIQPYRPPRYKDEKNADEVFFKLDGNDPEFIGPLRLFAAAVELASTSTGQKKHAYEDKAASHFKTLSKWLTEKFLVAIEVSYEGKKSTLSQALSGTNAAGMRPAEQVFTAASRSLTGHFATVCGDYPTFSRLLTFGDHGNAETAIRDALRGLSSAPTQMGVSVLDGLGLMKGDKIDPSDSPYAKRVLDLLNKKGHGQVLNRNELVENIAGIPYFVAHGQFRLEPELLMVVLASLVHAGEILLCVPGKDFAATDLKELATRTLDDLLSFKHIKKPKDWNLPAIKAVFELVGLPAGMALQVTQNDSEPLVALQTKILKRVENLVLSQQEFSHGIPFWGHKLLSEDEIASTTKNIDKAKDFLESLQAYKTPGQLKNFRWSTEEVRAFEPVLAKLGETEALKEFAYRLSGITNYLSAAESVLPEGDDWRIACQNTKDKLRADMLVPANRSSASFHKETLATLTSLKDSYIKAYLDLYRHARLDAKQDKQKASLLGDYRMGHLKQLAGIPSINRSQLMEIQDEFGKLKTGETLTAGDLKASPTCGKFFPAMETSSDVSVSQRLNHLSDRIEKTYDTWIQALLHELADPVVHENLKLLKPNDRKLVEDFLEEKSLPDPLPAKLIAALQQVLSGLSRVSLTPDHLFESIFPGGAAATVDELKERFAQLTDEITKGQDKAKVRIVLEHTSQASDSAL